MNVAEVLALGKTACVLEGSAYAKNLHESRKWSGIKQYPVQDLSGMTRALVNGECDCVIERQMHMAFVASKCTVREPALPPILILRVCRPPQHRGSTTAAGRSS
jgi:hypothetical protein